MKKYLIFTLFLLFLSTLNSQSNKYYYDATGNRIQKMTSKKDDDQGLSFFNSIPGKNKYIYSIVSQHRSFAFAIDNDYIKYFDQTSEPFSYPLECRKDSIGTFNIEFLNNPLTGFFQFILDDKLLKGKRTKFQLWNENKELVLQKKNLSKVSMINIQSLKPGQYQLLISEKKEKGLWTILVE